MNVGSTSQHTPDDPRHPAANGTRAFIEWLRTERGRHRLHH